METQHNTPFADYVDVTPTGSQQSVWFSPRLHNTCERAIKRSPPSLKDELLTAIANEIKLPVRLPKFLHGHDLHPYITTNSPTVLDTLYVMSASEALYAPETIIECVTLIHRFHELRTPDSRRWISFPFYISRRACYRLKSILSMTSSDPTTATLWFLLACFSHNRDRLTRFVFDEARFCVYVQLTENGDRRMYLMLECEWLDPPESFDVPF